MGGYASKLSNKANKRNQDSVSGRRRNSTTSANNSTYGKVGRPMSSNRFDKMTNRKSK